MNYERGSTWNKWDFHVHTPYSLLHNEYGFNPNAVFEGPDPFDEFVRKLFTKAVESGIVAIGITDYFSIDGYKRIKQDYLGRPKKMAELFPSEDLREKVYQILVFPNIELRLDTFVGRDCGSVNYHVILSDSVSISDIEEIFLQRLELIHTPDKTLPLTRNSIERFGQEYKHHNAGETRPDYLVGLERITVGHKQIMQVLEGSAILAGKFLISIPVDEDLSQIDWKGRDYQTRKVLYQQCHLLMTSNPRTRTWALAKGHEEEQISEFGSIKPCIWGSDAHSYDRMFCPSEERYCWIKADVTFEGLQQILYEPEDRVRIQKEKPEEKDDHQIIDHVVFEDPSFPDTPIMLSEGLTAIIGGKSTGKSILLRHIASGVDSKQVNERELRAAGTSSKCNVKARTVWKDGESGERRIIYIPQSWLNRIVDESSGDSQLNTMLRDILLQQEDISKANERLKTRAADIIASIKHSIVDYIAAYDKVEECERFLREFGRSAAFRSAIDKLESQRESLSAEAGITDELQQKYADLSHEIAEQNDILEAIKKEEPQIEFMLSPFVYLPQITTINNDSPQYDLSSIPIAKEKIEEAIQKMNAAILEIWQPTIQDAQQLITVRASTAQESLTQLKTAIGPLQQIVSQNDQLKKTEDQLKEEKEKLKRALATEETKNDFIAKASELKKQILSSRQELQLAYKEFASIVSSANTPESDLEFAAEVQDKRQDLFDAISGLFDNRNMRPFRDKYKYNILDKDDLVIDDGLFESLWEAMTDGTLGFKAGNSLQTALERLFADWLYIHYTVKSGDDTISSMSPGKKAMVLLEMVVNLEKSKCPILIDQPEDDLDNRSIYTDLVVYLKSKKHERQIIVVTHNANVVVGADAEEVIIANQNGKESPNREKRFEYRTGSIENTTPVLDDRGQCLPGVLNQKGIQEQICDILEGGRDAFELRRKKYIRS